MAFGSSGGISSYYAIPWWQTNVSMTANGGSTTFRNIPDVALVGDNVLVIARRRVFYPERRHQLRRAAVGGFHRLGQPAGVPASAMRRSVSSIPLCMLWPKASITRTCFNDTTNGNNTWSASPTKFFAVTNYDLCTGLGTPKGTNLINALTSSPMFS
jgi:hypothetical protein